MAILIAAFILALISVIAIRLVVPAVTARRHVRSTPVVMVDPIEKALPKPIKKLPNLLNLDELSRPKDAAAVERMRKDKKLYYKLQNLEDNLDAVSEARDRLVELFDITISEAQASPAGTILSIPKYDPVAVEKLLDDGHQANLKRYERYIARRRAKGPRELFVDAEYAKKWLRLASMVKFVDGGWIGAIVNSLPLLNSPTLADTELEQEFGDGDLEKNHVYLYEKLISDLNISDGRSSTSAFQPHFDGTAPEEGVPSCWKAAIAQQCIGLLSSPEDFFQEALGFNMAYECLAYHLLITSYELRELKVNDYYFNLHITIDNPSTGHSAMARVAVEKYMEGLLDRDGPEAVERAWKKIQAGFTLAEGLPTTPTKPVDGGDISNITSTPPTTPTTSAFADLICHKAIGSAQIHCASRLKFGGKTVEQWLDPRNLTRASAVDFANVLAEKSGWVVPGQPEKSRMVKELEWGGRMVGTVSRMEVDTGREWVKHLDTNPTIPNGVYLKHIDHDSSSRLAQIPTTIAPTAKHPLLPMLTLWMISLTLLDDFQLSPSKFATPLGMIILRIQRAQLGFISLHRPEDLCEGNDTEFDHTAAVGMWEIASKLWKGITGQNPGRDLRQLAQTSGGVAEAFVKEAMDLRQRPYRDNKVLMGMMKVFVDGIHDHPALAGQLNEADQEVLRRMVKDEREAMEEWITGSNTDNTVEVEDYQKGIKLAEEAIREATHGLGSA